ncbi:MAG: response regulator transcription factor [Nitrospirota bacterium]|nr:response regulator transcription factor [Nitrospirota bacterium]MDH5585392.1 response regulator transcription factor [Nitrospirota bacterium]MDH5773758.1 response regulator transcription factor [Nitrospirota bacterium]
MMNRIRILLADDHPMVLEGVKKILDEEFDVVGKVEDGRALVAAAQELTPDVIVTDMTMPLLHGLEACRQLKRLVGSKVIFLTMHADVAYAKEAFQAGASGYLLKRSAASELVEAIHTVIQGRTYLTPLVFLDDQIPLEFGSRNQVSMLKHLTPRQREVLQLIVEGKSMKEIAVILDLSVKTVDFHKTKLLETLHLQSNADLTKFALSHGLVEPASSPIESSC